MYIYTEMYVHDYKYLVSVYFDVPLYFEMYKYLGGDPSLDILAPNAVVVICEDPQVSESVEAKNWEAF
jgi:hypothetical protein